MEVVRPVRLNVWAAVGQVWEGLEFPRCQRCVVASFDLSPLILHLALPERLASTLLLLEAWVVLLAWEQYPSF